MQVEQRYVLVPVEPTETMLEAGWPFAHDEDARGTWSAMMPPALLTML